MYTQTGARRVCFGILGHAVLEPSASGHTSLMVPHLIASENGIFAFERELLL